MYALLLAYNADESAVLRLALQRAGFAARISTDLDTAVQEWPKQPSDMVLLTFRQEIPLPQIRQIRAQTDVPLVIIVDDVTEDLHVELLEAGVDLVIIRPFSARLLISQLRSLLRRATGTPAFSLPAFSVGELTLDPSIRTIQVGDREPVHLTRLEFRLVYNLMVHAEQVIPTETLVEQVWGYSGRGDRDLVRGLIKRLRNKVEPNPGEPRYIQTVPGVGYVMKR